MTPNVYVNDVGIVIDLDTGVDITNAGSVGVEVLKPDSTTLSIPGVVVGARRIQYVTEEGHIDQPGIYMLQAKVTDLDGFTGRGETVWLMALNAFR